MSPQDPHPQRWQASDMESRSPIRSSFASFPSWRPGRRVSRQRKLLCQATPKPASCLPCLSGRALKHKQNAYFSVKPFLNPAPKHHEKHSRLSPFRKATSGFRTRNYLEPNKIRRDILASYFFSVLHFFSCPRQYSLTKFLY